MTLAGFERLGIDDEPGATWLVPSALTAKDLHEIQDAIQKHRDNPVMYYGDDDPMTAEEMLRRKPNPSRRAAYDDDSDGIVSNGEEDFIFPGGGGPTNTNRKAAALDELKKSRRKRRHSGSENELDDETREARRNARLEADLEKRRKIKSAEFVVDSDLEDEEADQDFFQKEDERRKAHAAKVREALSAGRVDGGRAKKTKKRKSEAGNEGGGKKSKISAFYSDSEDDLPMEGSSSPPASRAASLSSGDEFEETPLSSPHPASSQEKILNEGTGNAIPLEDSSVSKGTVGADIALGGTDDENFFHPTTTKLTKSNRVRKEAVVSHPWDDDDDEDIFSKAPRSRQTRPVLVDSDDE